MKFHSKPVYNEKYIKAKVKALNGVVNTIFWNDKIPKENVHYTYLSEEFFYFLNFFCSIFNCMIFICSIFICSRKNFLFSSMYMAGKRTKFA